MSWDHIHRHASQQSYRAGCLRREDPAVRETVRMMDHHLEAIQERIYFSIGPSDPDNPADYWCDDMLERAHALVDLLHKFRSLKIAQ
jgi:hypothetical protein